MTKFNHLDYWKAITLFGLNVATYKPALAKILIGVANKGVTEIQWDDLSKCFLYEFKHRIETTGLPQQGNPGRKTKMESIVFEQRVSGLDEDVAISRVSSTGFVDVVPRFHTVGKDKSFAQDYFYEIDYGNRLILKDSLLEISKTNFNELSDEIEARWSLLEGGFEINHSNLNLALANDIRETYLKKGSARQSLSKNIPFLMGYQGNTCFYCGEPLSKYEIQVDHVLPYKIIKNNKIWNLVLVHSECNRMKLDLLIGPHFMEKLIQRNENLVGSSRPYKSEIQKELGFTVKQRRSKQLKHYEDVKLVIGESYWGGSKGYNPATDPFYRRLITKLNGR